MKINRTETNGTTTMPAWKVIAAIAVVLMLAGAVALALSWNGASTDIENAGSVTQVAGKGGKEDTTVGVPDTRSNAGYAYAMFAPNAWDSGATGTLWFFRSSNAYTDGTTQTIQMSSGETATGTVYSGVESLHATSAADTPWHGHAHQVVNIRVDDWKISPESTAHWFEGFDNSALSSCTLGFDYSQCTDMSYMFADSTVEGFSATGYNSNSETIAVDMSSVQNMSHMFAGCTRFNGTPEAFAPWNSGLFLSDSDKPSPTDMSYMFADCSSLPYFLASSLDTSDATDMSHMFDGCAALAKMDISTFDTTANPDMTGIFADCDSLYEITLGSNWEFNGSELPTPPNDGTYDGTWELVGSDPSLSYAPSALSAAYDGTTMAGTWRWSGYVPVSQSIPIRVIDSKGNPYAGARVAVSWTGNALDKFTGDNSTYVTTDANGTATVAFSTSPLVQQTTVTFDIDTPEWSQYYNGQSGYVTPAGALYIKGEGYWDSATSQWIEGQPTLASEVVLQLRAEPEVDYAFYSNDDKSLNFVNTGYSGAPTSGYQWGGKYVTQSWQLSDQPSTMGNWTSYSGLVEKVNIEAKIADTTYANSGNWFRNLTALESVEGLNHLELDDMSYLFYNDSSLAEIDLSGLDMTTASNTSHMFDGCTSLSSITIGANNTFPNSSAGCPIPTPPEGTATSTGTTTGKWKLEGSSDSGITASVLVSRCAAGTATGTWVWEAEPFVFTYAVLTNASDSRGSGKLIFFKSTGAYTAGADQTVTDIGANTYKGRVFTNLQGSANPAGSPWGQYAADVTSAYVASGQTVALDSCLYLFYNCTNLEEIDLSGFDTSNVSNMTGMFYGCSSLTEIDVSDLDTSSATNMNSMFANCSALETIDVSSFETEQVLDMTNMFGYCSSMTSANLAGVDMSGTSTAQLVARTQGMFRNCSALESINFTGSWVYVSSLMFAGCESLKSLDLSNAHADKLKMMYSAYADLRAIETVTLGNDNPFQGKEVTSGVDHYPAENPIDKVQEGYAWLKNGTNPPVYYTSMELAQADYANGAMAGTYTWSEILAPTTTLSMTIEDEAGAPIADKAVEIEHDNSHYATAVSNAAGEASTSLEYSEEEVTDYTATIEMPDGNGGVEDVTADIEVSSEGVITMAPEPTRRMVFANGALSIRVANPPAAPMSITHTMSTSRAVDLTGIAYTVSATPLTTLTSEQIAEGGRPVPNTVSVSATTITPATDEATATSTEYTRIYDKDVFATDMFGEASTFGLPGVYFFDVAESHSGGSSEAAGTWSYGNEAYRLRVVVVNDGEGGLAYDSVYINEFSGGVEGLKVDSLSFSSGYAATRILTVSKEVDASSPGASFGNTSYDFPFEITVFLPSWYAGSVNDIATAAGTGNVSTSASAFAVDSQTGVKSAVFTTALHDGESATIEVPVGTYYKIDEKGAAPAGNDVVDNAGIAYDVDIDWTVSTGAASGGSVSSSAPALPTAANFSSTPLSTLHEIGDYLVGDGATDTTYTTQARALVGQTIDVALNTGQGTMTARLVSVDNTRGLTFEAVDVLTTAAMNSSQINEGGWAASDLRTSMNSGDIYTTYFSNSAFAGKVRQVSNSSYSYGGGTNTSSDYYWIPSANNIYGAGWPSYYAGSGNYDDGDEQFDYYVGKTAANNEADDDLVKNYNSSANHWQLRSAGPADGGSFMFVHVGGGLLHGGADYSFGVAPCFCL